MVPDSFRTRNVYIYTKIFFIFKDDTSKYLDNQDLTPVMGRKQCAELSSAFNDNQYLLILKTAML